MKILLLTAALCGALALSASLAHASDTKHVDLRGFGTLEVTPRSFPVDHASWVTFAAQDAAHAALCGSKFVADLRGFGDIKPVADSGLPGMVVTLDGVAWWLVATHGATCEVLCARSQTALASLAKRSQATAWKPVGDRVYPPWMDCMDNAALGFWFLGGGVLPKDVNADFKWLAENGFAGCMASGTTEHRLIAPGLVDTGALDWYGAMASKYHVNYRMLLNWTMPDTPTSVWNRTPLPYVQPADGAVPYPDMAAERLQGYDAFVPIPAADPYRLDLRKQVAARATENPYFSGHHGTAELGGQTLVELSRYAGMPSAADAWYQYLQTEIGLTLAQAGVRYRGNAKAFASWADVKVPGLKDFTGWGEGSLDLAGTWDGHADPTKVGESAEWFGTGAPADWVPVKSNDVMLLEYSNNPTGYWLRCSIDLTADQATKLKYLHIARTSWHALAGVSGMAVYLNGVKLKDETVEHPLWPDQDQCVDLGDAAKPGTNSLVFKARGPLSYVFLSPVGRWAYPSADTRKNLLWYDAVDFTVSYKLKAVEDNLKATRLGDPNRPIKLMAPWNVMDRIPALCNKYGAYPHDTGQGAACWGPWLGRYVTWMGIPTSSEPGGPANTPNDLRQHMTFFLMLGNSMVDEVFHVDLYKDKPDNAKWIADNREMLRCIGKLNMPVPGIGVLRSLRSVRLGFQAPWGNDVARGEAQAVGRQADYVDLPDFANGTANAFKVIVDDGTAVLTEADVANIERYVRQGGTFVAFNITGMHTPGTPYSWPISRLTGLAVKNRDIGNSPISFDESETVWPTLRGKKLNGWGTSFDWLKNNLAGPALGQTAIDPSVKVIATWTNAPAGTGNIAIASRKLGKGTVLTVGSSFWRGAMDTNGHWISNAEKAQYFDELMNSVGVPRDSWVTGGDNVNQEVWAEHWRSKNGVYDVYPVARINTNHDQPPLAAQIKLRADRPLAKVVDLSATGHPELATSTDATSFSLPPVRLVPMEAHVYAAPRPDVENAALYWLGVQQDQWHALPAVAANAIPPAPPPPSDTLPLADGWRMAVGQPDTAWTAAGFNDAKWKTVKLGTFATLGLSEDSVAQFRHTVKLPTSWRNQQVKLVFDAPYWFWGVKQRGRLWINGEEIAKPIPTWNTGAFSVDVTKYAGTSKIAVALEVDGTVHGNDRQARPSGVSGTFYLAASPQPFKIQPIEGWQIATDVNVLSPITPGVKQSYRYLQATFAVPANQPAQRLFLESPQPLRWLVINQHVVACPDPMNALDISHMVNIGGENVIRWMPECPEVENPVHTYTLAGPVAPMALVWRE